MLFLSATLDHVNSGPNGEMGLTKTQSKNSNARGSMRVIESDW